MTYLFAPLILVMALTMQSENVNALETAAYQTIFQEGNIEIRHYDALMLVQTTTNEGRDRNRAFRKLFRYISGENSQAKKISMTTPVFMDAPEHSDSKMSFVLPRDIAASVPPIPNDATVQLSRSGEITLAAIRFSGRLTKNNIARNKRELLQWLNENDIAVQGPAQTAAYNSPFTLPFMRRNEVLIPVDPASSPQSPDR